MAKMIAAVTGATSGFGAAICRRFVADGHRVIAMGRRLERLEALQKELGAASVHIVQLDVRDRAATQSFMDTLPAEFSAVDVLVNNAGLALGLEPAQAANLDDWEVRHKTFCTNEHGDVTYASLSFLSHYRRSTFTLSKPLLSDDDPNELHRSHVHDARFAAWND